MRKNDLQQMNYQRIKKSKTIFPFSGKDINAFLQHFLIVFCLSFSFVSHSQVVIQGYVYEAGNRGYLAMAEVTALDNVTKALKGKTVTDLDGKFEIALDPGKEYLFRINKKPFEPSEKLVSTVGKSVDDKVFEKFEMKRMPGYVFEVTLAPARSDEDVVVDAITGAWIEVYNNTTDKEMINFKNHPSHTFSCRFEQGNHYTVYLRKKGYFNKRLEAYVNVKGCILCFDGVGEVKPDVSDVLTEGFEMGTLLANVEMQPVTMNKGIEINNIYYDKGSARLKTAAREELDQLIILLNDNSNLLVEIGAHTDSRGDSKFNQKLSLRRANSVVKYLSKNGISKGRLVPKGYGENKLRNRCKDGVECSERKHQKNRRTEFKIIGFVNQGLEDNRSLADLKEEERLEKLMVELDNEEEIRIPEGGELPEELKKQLEQKEEVENKEIKEQIPTPKVEKVIEETVEITQPVTTEIKREPSEVVKVETNEGRDIVLNVYKDEPENEPEPKLKPADNKPIPKIKKQIKKQEETVISSRDVMEDDVPFFDDIPEGEDFDSEQTGSMIPEKEVKTNAFVKAPKKLDLNYTGHKVQIVISTYELPLSHEIFSRHGNILLEETNKGTYAYLLGDFKNKEDAEDFMGNILLRQYTNARVISYQGGKRVIN